MAYQTKDVSGYVGSPGEKAILEPNLELPGNKRSAARILLHSFWNRRSSFLPG